MYQRDWLHRPQGERGFDLIWSIFIDDLINDSHLFYLKRGELESDSIKALLNRGRDVGVSLNNGPRFDGIIKCLHSGMEYGFMEVSTGNSPSFASKPLSESTKLVKGNRSAIVHGSNVVEDPKEFRDHYPLVGIQVSGDASIDIALHPLTPQDSHYGSAECLRAKVWSCCIGLVRPSNCLRFTSYNPKAFRQVLQEGIALRVSLTLCCWCCFTLTVDSRRCYPKTQFRR